MDRFPVKEYLYCDKTLICFVRKGKSKWTKNTKKMQEAPFAKSPNIVTIKYWLSIDLRLMAFQNKN